MKRWAKVANTRARAPCHWAAARRVGERVVQNWLAELADGRAGGPFGGARPTWLGGASVLATRTTILHGESAARCATFSPLFTPAAALMGQRVAVAVTVVDKQRFVREGGGRSESDGGVHRRVDG